MKHTEISLRRPVTTLVVFVALALIGLIASRLLPLEKFPDIEFPGIFIQIPYEGSTPEEVERLITRPIEEALATLSGVEQMYSSSGENMSQVFLQFDWDQSMANRRGLWECLSGPARMIRPLSGQHFSNGEETCLTIGAPEGVLCG